MAEREGYDHKLAQEIARLGRILWRWVIVGVVVCLVVVAGFAVFWPR